MTDKLKELLNKGRITSLQYTNYLVFEANELGRQYLKDMIEAVVLDGPIDYLHTTRNYEWIDGRISVWREIASMIMFVKTELLKEEYNDR